MLPNREIRLLATDQQRSVLSVMDTSTRRHCAYTPYGYRPLGNGLFSLLGFNGERPEPLTGWYLLGNGYRAFNPVFMRFTSPDSWSPFGEGGTNAYAYCDNNPANNRDPAGHASFRAMGAVNKLSIISNRSRIIHRKPLPKRALKVPGPRETTLQRINFIDSEIFSYVDHDKKMKRLNIVGHGGEISTGRYAMKSANGALTEKDLANIIKAGNDHYDYIRLIMCNSATGKLPFASKMAELTKKPTKGYFGIVYGNPHPEDLLELIRTHNSVIRKNLDGTYDFDGAMTLIKEKPYNYVPVMYLPPAP